MLATYGARLSYHGKINDKPVTKPLICFDIKEENGKIEILVPERKRWSLVRGTPGFGPCVIQEEKWI